MKSEELKTTRTILLLLPILALLCSCEDSGEGYRYPSVVTDYACLITDATGYAEQLLLDNGRYYPINITNDLLETNDGERPHFKADTTIRVISAYELVPTEHADTVAYLYAVSSTVSYMPTPLPEGEKMSQAPVYLQSIWLSGGYLNIVLEIKALNGKHSVGYVDTTPEGMHGKEFTFYHKVINDVESYRQKFYGSIPLAPFSEHLQQGDTLRFVVNTYDKGNTSHEFTL